MRSMWRRRLVRSSRFRASEAPASFGFGWTSAAGRAVVVAISSPSSVRRDLPSLRFVVSAPYGIAAWRASVCDRWYSRRRPFGGGWTEVRWGREHGRRVLGTPDAVAPPGGVALAAVPGGDGARRTGGRLAAAERHVGPVRAGARDLLVRQSVPDRGRGAVARTSDGRPAGSRAPAVVHVSSGEPRRAADRPHRGDRPRAGPARATHRGARQPQGGGRGDRPAGTRWGGCARLRPRSRPGRRAPQRARGQRQLARARAGRPVPHVHPLRRPDARVLHVRGRVAQASVGAARSRHAAERRGLPQPLTGTLINVGAILLGTVIGLLLGHRLPAGMQERVMLGLGLVTLVLGVDNALEWRDTSPLIVFGAVLLGGVLGEWIGIERRLAQLGDAVQARVSRGGASRVSEAFVTASLLFCIGPLTVVGSIQDGLTGDYQTLASKALLDGFASIAFAAALGWGVALAAVTVLVVQGGLTQAAGLFEHVLGEGTEALAALVSAGGVLIIGISLKLLSVKDVKVGNYLPALVLAPCIVGIVSVFR